MLHWRYFVSIVMSVFFAYTTIVSVDWIATSQIALNLIEGSNGDSLKRLPLIAISEVIIITVVTLPFALILKFIKRYAFEIKHVIISQSLLTLIGLYTIIDTAVSIDMSGNNIYYFIYKFLYYTYLSSSIVIFYLLSTMNKTKPEKTRN